MAQHLIELLSVWLSLHNTLLGTAQFRSRNHFHRFRDATRRNDGADSLFYFSKCRHKYETFAALRLELSLELRSRVFQLRLGRFRNDLIFGERGLDFRETLLTEPEELCFEPGQ